MSVAESVWGFGRPEMSRRAVLTAMGGGLAAGVAGCSVQVTDDPAKTGPSTLPISIPDPQVDLPTEHVTFRWTDSGYRKSHFEKAVFEAYHDKHDNIEIDYTGIGFSQLDKVLPLGIRNGTAPDVFTTPSNVPNQTVIDEGWVQPVEDLIPNFDRWKSKFPEGLFVPGTHIYDGKLWSVPLTRSREVGQLMIFDVEYLQQAGVDDPDAQLTTWDQFRTVAKQITKNGKGNYFGFLGNKQNTALVRALAQAAGWTGTMDHGTGEYQFSHDRVLDAVEFALAMRDDGSFFPDYAALETDDALHRMPTRVAGIIVAGAIAFLNWREEAPDWRFDVKRMPTPDGGTTYNVPYTASGMNATWVYKKSKYPEIAADLYTYMTSPEGQVQLVLQTGGQLPPIFPDAVEKADAATSLDPAAKKAQHLADELCKRVPVPAFRNPDIAQVEVKAATVRPSFQDVMEGTFTGQISDYKKALTTLDSKLNTNLDKAIAAARKNGADVSRDDYVFPNWDPNKDYTLSDYEDLP